MNKNYEIQRLDWTPNPNAFKLILNEKVTAGAGLNFTTPEEAKEKGLSPLRKQALLDCRLTWSMVRLPHLAWHSTRQGSSCQAFSSSA